MTPYRGPRMRQISSQWEWEEQLKEERAEAIEKEKLTLRRDYGWHRIGWRWEVRLSWLDDGGNAIYTQRVVPYRFWREDNAAAISNAIFCAYCDGRSVQRDKAAAASSVENNRTGEASAEEVIVPNSLSRPDQGTVAVASADHRCRNCGIESGSIVRAGPATNATFC